MHGEDGDRAFLVAVYAETPPRAWGRQDSVYRIDGVIGNTPTCMGKTLERDARGGTR